MVPSGRVLRLGRGCAISVAFSECLLGLTVVRKQPRKQRSWTPTDSIGSVGWRDSYNSGVFGVQRLLVDNPGYPIVELGGIEPPSARWSPNLLRPFPTLRLTAAGPAGRLARRPTAGSFPDVSGLSRCQWSLPTVHPRFCCRAAVIRPRAPSLVTIFLLQTDQIRLRERTAHSWRFFCCPRLTSLKQLGSQTRLPGPNVETSQPRCFEL